MCENSHWPQAQTRSFSKFLASKSGLNSLATQSSWWQLSCDQPGLFLLTQKELSAVIWIFPRWTRLYRKAIIVCLRINMWVNWDSTSVKCLGFDHALSLCLLLGIMHKWVVIAPQGVSISLGVVDKHWKTLVNSLCFTAFTLFLPVELKTIHFDWLHIN